MYRYTKIFFYLIILTVIAFALRIYKVDSAPSGILIDEASFGYNAYSILETGRDEHGVALPLVFKAFGDQKLPAYAYTLVPFVKIFGLNNLAVRLPSVLAGTALSVIIFFLLLEFGISLPISFLGGLITATSPWAIILSRFGFESNFGLLFFSLGLLFALIAYRKNMLVVAVLSGLCFSITLYSYVAFKLITPLMLISFIFIFRNISKKNNFISVAMFFSFLVFILPIIFTVFSSQTTARFTQLGLNYNAGLKMEIDEDRAFCSNYLPRIICFASSNKPLFYVRTYLHRYISALSPSYLFLDGDIDYIYLNVEHFGAFYLWLLPFYLLGLLHLWKKIKTRTLSPFEKIVIVGLIIFPLPTILVSGPQKVRISALFPLLVLLIIYGVLQFEEIFKKRRYQYFLHISLISFSIISVVYFMVHFLTIQINKYESAYGTYIPKLMTFLGDQDRSTQIYIRSITEGIMYFAYSNKIDPVLFQKKVKFEKPDMIGFSHAYDFDNIHITEEDAFGIACKTRELKTNVLFVSNENNPAIKEADKKIIYSENGVDTLAVIYNLNKINYDYSLCPPQ